MAAGKISKGDGHAKTSEPCRNLLRADMTVQSSSANDDGVVKWQANANVAYEVGLAVKVPTGTKQIDMVEAAKVDTTNEAATPK